MIKQTSIAILAVLTIGVIYFSSQKAMSYGKSAETPATPEGHEVITLGAGCFWCVEEKLKTLLMNRSVQEQLGMQKS